MSKKTEHIQVRATKDGKLYVNVVDLFNQQNVQELIRKMAESEVLKREDIRNINKALE